MWIACFSATSTLRQQLFSLKHTVHPEPTRSLHGRVFTISTLTRATERAGSGPSSRQEWQRYGSPAPLEGGRTGTDGSRGAEVSAAWARVAGGSGGLNAWYQQDRLPRSADNTGHNSPPSNTNSNFDEKWVSFARQEVAELRLPTLQPKATFLL